MGDLDKLSWPVSRLGEAIEALARTGALAPRSVEVPSPPHNLAQDGAEGLGRWIEATAGSLGLEAEPVDVPYAEVERLVRSAGPALLRLPSAGEPLFLALLSGRRRAVSILGPDRRLHRLRPDVICRALCHHLEQLHIAQVDQLLGEAKVPKRRQARARVAIGWLGALEQRTGLREIIPQLVHRICRISKGSELSAHHGLRQAEGVATEQIDMAPPQRS